MKKRRCLMAFFFVALMLAAVAELLPLSLYAADGEMHARLWHRVPVLFFATGAALAVLLACGRGALLRPRRLSLPRGTRAAFVLLFLVALNNFPFYTLAHGHAFVSVPPAALLAYILGTLLTATVEELFFRGLLLPYFFFRFSRSVATEAGGEVPSTEAAERKSLLLSVASSSLFFGGVHIFNLFGGASLPDTLLQIGYSTLIGAAASLLFLLGRSLWVPILFHFIYNLGGLLVPTFGGGSLGLPLVIFTTAALSVLAAAASVYAVLHVPMRHVHALFLHPLSENL